MYGRKPSLPEDTICRVLDSLDYDDISAFKEAHRMLALVTKPAFSTYVKLDQDGIDDCAKDFRTKLEAATQFLDQCLLDVAKKAKTTKAVEDLNSAINRAMTPETPGLSRN